MQSATLEEVVAADLLLHVVDATAEDVDRRRAAVERVLTEVGAESVARVIVYNKCDRVPTDVRRRLERETPPPVCISAITGEGVDSLLAVVAEQVGAGTQRIEVTVEIDDPAGRAVLAELYARGRVVDHQVVDGRAHVVAEVPRSLAARLGR